MKCKFGGCGLGLWSKDYSKEKKDVRVVGRVCCGLTRLKQVMIAGLTQLQKFTRMPQYLSFCNLKTPKTCSQFQ